jgi:hypothetical protein
MSGKISLTIEGTAEEVARACLIIARGTETATQEVPPVTQDPWTPDEVRQLWVSITGDARRVLKEIANKPDGYNRDDLLKALSLQGSQLAGILSSVGHQMKRFPGKERPVDLDWGIWVYRMPSEVAAEIPKLTAQHD